MSKKISRKKGSYVEKIFIFQTFDNINYFLGVFILYEKSVPKNDRYLGTL